MQHEPVLKLAMEDYDMKMRGMLNTAILKQLKKDPTATQESRLSQKMETDGKISGGGGDLYHRLRTSSSQPPSINSLSNIHKDNVQLRPIVSCIRTPSYQLSDHIPCLIFPLTGKTGSFEMCLKSMYFSYRGEFFEQLEGAAMGSPVSAVVADLYMEFFEELALKTARTKLHAPFGRDMLMAPAVL